MSFWQPVAREGDDAGKQAMILKVQNLQVHFPAAVGVLRAVDDVSFSVPRGGTLGIVGESGSGKSMSALAILRLIQPPGRIAGGQAWYFGQGSQDHDAQPRDLMEASEREMRQIRGAEIAIVFQEPMTALNPVLTIGSQIQEAIRAHAAVSRREAEARTVEVMRSVAIPAPEHRMRRYPHQLSGGLRQRALIALSLAARPKLLIADEPTTALDVTIQAQILDLLLRLKDELQLSLVIISHDLGVIAETADSVAVMYAGKIVEYGPMREVLRNPLHPYTEALLKSVPRPRTAAGFKARLESIPGTVPDLLRLPPGCPFRPRCQYDLGSPCSTTPIPLKTTGEDRQARCVKYV